MGCEVFVPRKFRAAKAELVEQANAIIKEYRADGFKLTVRQLYYQLVARALIENCASEYVRVKATVKEARLAGMIDWDAIEDRTRSRRNHLFFDDPADRIEAAAYNYQENPWLTQKYRPEVWIEKDALLGVIEDVCDTYHVRYASCRGDTSVTMLYQAAKQFKVHLAQGRIPVVLHLADHDPKGLHMTKDIRTRLELLTRSPVEVRRLALDMDQIKKHKPPPGFAKEDDTLYPTYRAEFGDKCWELDALSPATIAKLIRDELGGLIEPESWSVAKGAEEANKERMEKLVRHWDDVETLLDDIEEEDD